MSYEQLKGTLSANFALNNFLLNFFSGAIAGMISSLITIPFDVMKTRQQMNVHKLTEKSHIPTFQLAKHIIKNEGWSGLVKGVVPRTVRVAPACAIMISSYELVKSYLVSQDVCI